MCEATSPSVLLKAPPRDTQKVKSMGDEKQTESARISKEISERTRRTVSRARCAMAKKESQTDSTCIKKLGKQTPGGEPDARGGGAHSGH